MNKKLMFLFLLILSFSAFALMPEEETLIPSEEQSEFPQEPTSSESSFPQMQEDPSFDMPAETPDDYQDTEVIDDPSIEYEN